MFKTFPATAHLPERRPLDTALLPSVAMGGDRAQEAVARDVGGDDDAFARGRYTWEERYEVCIPKEPCEFCTRACTDSKRDLLTDVYLVPVALAVCSGARARLPPAWPWDRLLGK